MASRQLAPGIVICRRLRIRGRIIVALLHDAVPEPADDAADVGHAAHSRDVVAVGYLIFAARHARDAADAFAGGGNRSSVGALIGRAAL